MIHIAVQGQYRRYVLFRGIVNGWDDDEYGDLDLSELDARAYSLRQPISRIQPNRDPQLEVDYLGITGDIEIVFNFRTTWMDRDSDMYDYLEEVQSEVENGMDVLITEREVLGIREV